MVGQEPSLPATASHLGTSENKNRSFASIESHCPARFPHPTIGFCFLKFRLYFPLPGQGKGAGRLLSFSPSTGELGTPFLLYNAYNATVKYGW